MHAWTPSTTKSRGLLALAANDTRKVVEAAQSGDEHSARLALDMTSYRLMKLHWRLPQCSLVVGGAQALIFTAGIS